MLLQIPRKTTHHIMDECHLPQVSRRSKTILWVMRLLLLLVILSQCSISESQDQCTPIYVRWYRVRLNLTARVSGPYSKEACQRACSLNEHPARAGFPLACIGFNHRQGPNSLAHDCQIFQSDQLNNIDAHAEADDRYSFYWKYCVTTEKVCNSNYHFAFYTDRYMDKIEVARAVHTNNLEECLGICLDETTFTCRSVSYNRTDGGCYLSPQNQLSKPRYIRVNNNPNFRIDYYESNCYNNTFTFKHDCKEDGVEVSVESKFPYTGVLYGLYDYFTCRVEPEEEKKFSYFFPFPSVSKSCTDSMRRKGNDMVLEVVVSTDGIEPLYFITPEDLTYQARCPNPKNQKNKVGATLEFSQKKNPVTNSTPSSLSLTTRSSTVTLSVASSPRYRVTIPGKKVSASLPVIDSEHKTVEKERNQQQVRGTRISLKFPLSGGRSVTTSVDGETTSSTPRNTQGIYVITEENGPSSTFPPVRSYYTAPTYYIPDNSLFPTFSSTERSTSTERKESPTSTTTRISTVSVTTKETTSSTSAITDARAESSVTSIPLSSTASSTFLSLYTTARESSERNRTDTYETDPSTDSSFDRIPVASTRKPTVIDTNPTSTTRPSPSVKSYTLKPRTIATKIRVHTTTPEPSTTSTTTALSTTSTTKGTTTTSEEPNQQKETTATTTKSTTEESSSEGTTSPPQQPILFDIFHGGRPTEAVVVGSKITMTFTPSYPVPPAYMTVAGCQVEPVGSLYDWEREPLPIVKDGCQADNVGLVCPPEKTDFGIRIVNEAFRYQSTATVLYTCLVRVCPFAPCPQNFCPPVDGCVDTGTTSSSILSRNFRRYKRQSLAFPQLPFGNTPRQFLLGQRQISLPGSVFPEVARPPAALQQYLLALAGDHIVSRRLIVVNSENELGYYLRTGSVPKNRFYGKRKR